MTALPALFCARNKPAAEQLLRYRTKNIPATLRCNVSSYAQAAIPADLSAAALPTYLPIVATIATIAVVRHGEHGYGPCLSTTAIH